MKQVNPSEVSGEIAAPASKSMMQRAVAAAILSRGTTEILNPSFCEDCEAALGIAKALGAKVRKENGGVLIESRGIVSSPPSRELDCGESGTCIRMFAPIAGLYEEELVLSGRGSLMSRPVGMVKDALLEIGARVGTAKGYAPIKVRGPINSAHFAIDCSETSQLLSGLLMALPLCEGDSSIEARNLKSSPYVDMTISLLGHFGVKVERDGEHFEIMGGQKYHPSSYTVEGDWSSASFLFVAGAVSGSVTVLGLDSGSLQGDKRILEVLGKAGAKVESSDGAVLVEKGALMGFEFDASDCPDLFPPLVALACNCSGKSVILGVRRLLGKESNRAAALVSEFGKLGAKIRVAGDAIEIEGGAKLSGGEVDSHSDHRIAMACAVAALNCSGSVRILNAECVSKSYPSFFEDLEKLAEGKGK
ncbi:3-phosphoshikimate 1-carboxyvinyltransferase [Candidatus Micrarchaeota archaeon]|nr:3-phosphoshikimate 1-carboxyvinyltransferase [Candidatus Micrarchaeota archaeon]